MIDPAHELGVQMPNPKLGDYAARDSILKLLSETELARVSTAEESPALAATDEYIDLEHLEHGVRKAPIEQAAASRMLPRSAVSATTWTQILAVLGAKRV